MEDKFKPEALPIKETADRLGIGKVAVHGLINRGQLEVSHRGPIGDRYRSENSLWVTVESIEKRETLLANSYIGDK